MLAALAAEIVIASHLPACAEMTWFAKFSILSMVFAFVSLLESVAVLYFYYKSNEDLGEWIDLLIRIVSIAMLFILNIT